MDQMLRILMLEDAPADAALIERELRKAKFRFAAKRVETREDFIRELQAFSPDLILSDYSLPSFDGFSAMALAKQLAPLTPFIIVTGSLDEETAVECIKNGAADYVIKERVVRLGPAIESALEKKRAREAKEQAEERLHRSEETFRGIVEAAAEGIWITNQEGKTTFVNQTMADMLGYSLQETMERRIWSFVSEEDRESFRSKLLARRRTGAERYDVRFVRKDGSELWAIVSASPMFDNKGQFAGSLKMVTDITERKRSEKELAAKAEQLARYNAELERFAYVSAHDLQEPLRTVASFTQLLAQRYQGQLDEDGKRFIQLAVAGCARMRQLIEDLLAYSRVARRPAEFALTDCQAICARAIEGLRAAIEESAAVVTYGPLPALLADPARLSQLFSNLIGNALKFRAEQPPHVHISADRKGSEWLFAVRDNGIGIDPAHAEKIFEIFQRLHGKQQYPGTGVGLALCKMIVQSHGGRIWVESQPGQGATFYFTLPARS